MMQKESERVIVVGAGPVGLCLSLALAQAGVEVCTIEALGEAMALVGKAGVDRHRYLEILTSTLFTAPMYKMYGGLIAEQRFEPAGFAAPLGHKDIRLTLAAAETLRVPMPFASVLHDRFLTLLADWAISA